MFARACFVVVAICAFASGVVRGQTPNDPLAWPEITQSARPWTRWWWQGSAVDEANITRLLETYKAAGLGGVEITCIYGVKGSEDHERPYLSESWLAAVRHTLKEAKRLGLGVDLPTGSGWRMGGPSVTDEHANRELVLRGEPFSNGVFERSGLNPRPQAIVAFGPDGKIVDLTDKIDADGNLKVQLPAGPWTVYTVADRWSRDSVKRPAPGGQGKNINPYSRQSLDHYLEYFANKIGDLPAEGIRAQFHDSFEYEGNWCDGFLAEFEKRRGYKLQEHLPALDGKGDAADVAAVKHDYRETLSDLVLENLIQPWTAWSHAHSMLARNQSHGSPANWLDLYGAVDIPEAESFGRLNGGDGHPLVFKFASSAAHVMGRPLVSSETGTWIDEHFHETLGELKEMCDRQFLAGVNHIIYHGTAYSPADAAWPGWVFYAASELNPQNPIWRDLPALNEYVARCESILQTTKPDNDVLLYWPIHDLWQSGGPLRMNFQVHNARQWLLETPFGKTAQWLDDTGRSFDYLSDRQVLACQFKDGRIQATGGSYRTIVVPGAKHVPIATMRQLVELAIAGATVVFEGSLPAGPPGLSTAKVKEEWDNVMAPVFRQAGSTHPGYSTTVGKGRFLVTGELAAALDELGVRRESWRKVVGLNFIRRRSTDGHMYFIKNEGVQSFDGWIAPAVEWQGGAIVFNPLIPPRGGAADSRTNEGKDQVRLQLGPGESVFVNVLRGRLPFQDGNSTYAEEVGDKTPITGEWSVEFVAGGAELPSATRIEKLESWTKFAGAVGERFGGTARYTIEFDPPDGEGSYRINLGKVADSARVVWRDGEPSITLFSSPFQCDVWLRQHAKVEVEVTNVAANRIRDLDRRRVNWKIFKDINVVDINYRPLDASRWPVREAGLLGPVTIQKIKVFAGP